MDESTISFLKDLNDKINLLLSSREPQVQIIQQGENLTANAPVTNLTPYKKLTEALPSIKENFFKSPKSKEEKKDAIFAYPRNTSMNYSPSPLNEDIRSTVKKSDAAFYAAQRALNQITRSIDYYAQELLEQNPGIPADGPRHNFASSMRMMISDVETLLSQSRIDNTHRTMDLPGKQPQIMRKDEDPLWDDEVLKTLITAKNAENKSIIRKPFLQRQQSTYQKSLSFNSIPESAYEATVSTTVDNQPLRQQ
ncbi:hypothetical protein AYI70_g2766 [Smittium culicis]|uniref:Uncharacterized protein n=1 Tax=Smittium culicis TaxID=133412 RepID=A0A1R1Y6L3_9FUNG|nr:hypothetical protein AYI70_g2766 [Smittium culicis]